MGTDCHVAAMFQSATVSAPVSERQDAILEAAFRVFATYGFRRTSMDDIAKAVGMSRSALYLHYRNKEDIFRSLTQRFMDKALRDMAEVLSRDLPPEKALIAAFAAKDGPVMEAILGTPHGAELMDAGTSISCDLVTEAEARIVAVLADWLQRRTLADGIGSPEDIAQTILAALKGLKASARDLAGYRAGQAQLARLFARALAP
jgi:AcrR family transcriptional regulator